MREISATAKKNTLPVLSNRMMVTETLPLWINGTGSKNFTFQKLLASGNSNTLSQFKLTAEYTANPAWYAVQALPYLMEYPHECAEQTFNRYYATALAGHIVKLSPKIEEIFRQWETLDTAALLSNLEKNQELKSALLEETPWVRDAQSETQQKHRIAMLFQTRKLAKQLDKFLRSLEQKQMSDGAFPWFSGMGPDRYITQYIATGLARLQKLGVSDKRTEAMQKKATDYCSRAMLRDYEYLIREKIKLDQENISNFQVQYLYLKSFR